MIYNNMNVLEFLMFSMSKSNTNQVELQEQIFEFIIDIGLGELSLTPNKMLTKEEKAVITLITAAYSDSMMIIFNLPEYEFNEVLTGAIAKISCFIMHKGKTLILGTQSCLLIEKACSHTAYIADGGIIYQGSVENLRSRYDKVVVIIRDKSIYHMMDKLAVLLPNHKLSIRNDSLLISNYGKEEDNAGYIYEKIIETDFIPGYMETNIKNVQNAYEEIVLQYDLQK